MNNELLHSDESSLNNKVVLFGEEVILDKTIYVTLDNSWDLFSIHPESLQSMHYVGDYCNLCRAIKERRETIITPITKCICSSIMERGYDIVVQSKDKSVRFSELLMGSVDKAFGRQIREAQNWEKMLYSGCFDLDIPSIV